jgi:hypothetical protein
VGAATPVTAPVTSHDILEEGADMDPMRRNILTTGAAAAATAATPRVFAQQAGQGPGKFYEKGNVRIRYEEVGAGFPLLVTPGGGLNSRISNWPNAVFNAMEVFKSDFRCITMDQRNANGGESTGPIQVDDPWGAFADDQLGLMDHLGIRRFFFMGYCIGGPFALKLMERAGASAPNIRRHRIAGAECRDHRVSLEGAARAEGPHDQPRAQVPEGASAGDGGAVKELTSFSIEPGSRTLACGTCSILLGGACPYRKTGVHFSGTCANA